MNGIQANLLAVLEFSSLPMLGWLAAAVVPWLIHRWHRQQHRVTSWAAVELLLNAMQRRGRRVQMQQWLLLAIRMTILALVALAAAEPALRQWAIGAGQSARTHRIIVVDQSCSMESVTDGGSRWQRAVDLAIQSVETNPGDALSLIAWGVRCENVLGRPTFDASIVASALGELGATNGCVEVPDLVQAILAAIERAEEEIPGVANHQIVLCTDLCSPTWDLQESERESLKSLGQRASITLVNLSEEGSSNFAVTDLRVEPSVTMRQQEVEILARIASFGEPLATETRVELEIDGRPIGEQSISLKQGDEKTVRFTHRFINEGAKTLRVRLVDAFDSLPTDDQRWLVTRVRPQLRVACFAGESDAVDDLVRALSPSQANLSRGGEIVPEAYSVSRIGDSNLKEYDLVLLGSISTLSQREIESLQEYVRQGGGLAFCLGATVDQRTLAGLEPLLPVEVTAEQPEGDFRFNTLEYRHPIVAPFRGQTQAGLLGVAIMKYQRLRKLPGRGAAEEVIAFDSGDPALVVGQFGLGRVAVFALPGSLSSRTPAGTPWSTFPMSPSFLPVVRELCNHLVSSRGEQANVLVGEAVSLPSQNGDNALEVRSPDGSVRSLRYSSSEKQGSLIIHETDQQGVHQVFDGDQEVDRFAVNLDPRESDVQPVSPEELPNAFADQEIQASVEISKSRGDISFTRTLLAATSALLLVEVGVASAMGRGWG